MQGPGLYQLVQVHFFSLSETYTLNKNFKFQNSHTNTLNCTSVSTLTDTITVSMPTQMD